MKFIEYNVGPCPFLESVLPWLLEHSSMFVNCAVIGMWAFGIPDAYTGPVIESEKQYKDFFSEYVWEARITFPALSENCPVTDEAEFMRSPYQVYLYYYDGNFLNVWFKDDQLADAFMRHLEAGTVIYPTKNHTGPLSRKDQDGFSLWKE